LMKTQRTAIHDVKTHSIYSSPSPSRFSQSIKKTPFPSQCALDSNYKYTLKLQGAQREGRGFSRKYIINHTGILPPSWIETEYTRSPMTNILLFDTICSISILHSVPSLQIHSPSIWASCCQPIQHHPDCPGHHPLYWPSPWHRHHSPSPAAPLHSP